MKTNNYSDPFLSTLFKHLWQQLVLSLLTTSLEFLPFFSADPFSPEMFDWVQVRAMAGSLKDIQRLVTKPFLRCLGCVLRVIVLLEGEPLPSLRY